MRSIFVLLLLVSCSKPAPTADCDAFAKQFAAHISSPSDGEVTKKAIEVTTLMMQGRCKADKWSPALADCIVKSPEGSDVTEVCAKQFTGDQLQHLKTTSKQQAEGLRKALDEKLAP